MLYRLLGHERVVLTENQLEALVREGILTIETKVMGQGETFAAAIGARPEFEHLKNRQPGAPQQSHRDGPAGR